MGDLDVVLVALSSTLALLISHWVHQVSVMVIAEAEERYAWLKCF